MKRAPVLILIASVVSIVGLGAVSFAAWNSSRTSVSVDGHTGKVSYTSGLTVETSDGRRNGQDGEIEMQALYPVDHTGAGLKFWTFDIKTDGVGDPDIMFALNGTPNNSADMQIYWSLTAPSESIAGSVALGADTSYVYIPQNDEPTRIYFFMKALSVSAMNVEIALEFGARDIGAPVIELNGNPTELSLLEDETTPIPEPTVMADDGSGVIHNIDFNVTSNDINVVVSADNTTKAAYGQYEGALTYTPVQGRIQDRCTKTFDVRAYRKIFGQATDGTNAVEPVYIDGAKFVDDKDQQARFGGAGYNLAEFNMLESDTYYAEATFRSNVERLTWSDYVGMTHCVKSDPKNSLTMYIDRGAPKRLTETDDYPGVEYNNPSRTFCIKKFDRSKSDEIYKTLSPYEEEANKRDRIYRSDQIHNLRGLNDGTIKPFPLKMAVARVDDMFYAFVNDQYVMSCSERTLVGKNTVAGIFQKANAEISITNISWTGGDAARDKLNTLTQNGSKVVGAFVPTEWFKDYGGKENSGDTGDKSDGAEEGALSKDAITYSETSAEFTYTKNNSRYWGGTVSPHLVFDGDFTFEWEYTFDTKNVKDGTLGSSWAAGSMFEIRNYYVSQKLGGTAQIDNGVQCLQVHADYGHNSETQVDGLCATVMKYTQGVLDGKEKADLDGIWDWNYREDADAPEKFNVTVRFKVTRKCDFDNNSAVYKICVSEIDDNAAVEKKTYSIKFEGNGDSSIPNWESPTMPVKVIWLNKYMSGTYSNINYKPSVD